MPRFQQDDAPAAQASFATVERFLTTDTDLAYGYTNLINEDALKEAYENVRSHHAPPVVSGTDLLRQIKSKIRILSSGCESIDAMLEGGFREGQVLELYGDSGSGKTQLCMMACARAAARKENVLYIDTSNAFTATRIVTILKAEPNATASLEEAVESISVVRAYTAHAALTALDNLLQKYSPSTSLESATDAASKKPTLVILDSLGAVMAPVLGAGGSGSHLLGHVLLAAAATLLKQVAQQLNAAVLVTNHMVGGGGGGGGVGNRGAGEAGTSAAAGRYTNNTGPAAFESEFKRPALGESWNHQCHCRVQLLIPPADGHPWTAVVRASTLLVPGKRIANYWLCASGASAVAPTAT